MQKIRLLKETKVKRLKPAGHSLLVIRGGDGRNRTYDTSVLNAKLSHSELHPLNPWFPFTNKALLTLCCILSIRRPPKFTRL